MSSVNFVGELVAKPTLQIRSRPGRSLPGRCLAGRFAAAFGALVLLGCVPPVSANDEVTVAHACTVNAKQMGAAFRALSAQMRAPRRDNAAITTKLGEAEGAYDSARAACAPIPEMTADMELVGEELARIRASLGLSPRAN